MNVYARAPIQAKEVTSFSHRRSSQVLGTFNRIPQWAQISPMAAIHKQAEMYQYRPSFLRRLFLLDQCFTIAHSGYFQALFRCVLAQSNTQKAERTNYYNGANLPLRGPCTSKQILRPTGNVTRSQAFEERNFSVSRVLPWITRNTAAVMKIVSILWMVW